MITVREAKQIAKEWVEAEAPNIPQFRGAVMDGSILWKNDDEPQPATSDVDVKILVDIDNPKLIEEQGLIQQNLAYQGIILETNFSPFQNFSTPERVLADFAYGAHFSVPNILSDPSGELSKMQKDVAARFAQKEWVIKRIEGARDFALMFFDNTRTGALEDLYLALAFALGGGIVQIPIQAELRPPTVRKAGILFKKIMENHERQDLHEIMLKIYGSQSMTRADVERHLDDLTITFDHTLEIIQSPNQWDSINPITRPFVIDASGEMINDGFHREAMNWIVTKRTICQQTILRDAPDAEQKKYTEQYHKLLAELGLHSEDDFQKRAEVGKQLLEDVMQVAEQIMEANERVIE